MSAPKNKSKQTQNANTQVDPRAIALKILQRVEEDKSYSNLLLNSKLKEVSLSKRDIAFLTTLVYGVIEKQFTLDFFISKFAKRSAKEIESTTLNILRLGTFQILFLDKVPSSAAVNEAVRLAKMGKSQRAAGFVNAVLRRISENKDNMPYPDKEKDFKRYLHVKYSCPQWLLTKWIQEYSKETTLGILTGIENKPYAVLRTNTLLTTTEELIDMLDEEDIKAEKIDYLPNALKVDKLNDLSNNDIFNEGYFTVQNSASQICCLACNPKPGDSVIDMCSAPGGKSFTMAMEMQNKGSIKSLEIYENRLKLIRDGADRLSIKIIEEKQNNAAVHNESLGEADIVLCDVPCSGLGVIGRKPEIKFKNPKEFDELPSLQYSIICEGSTHVKAGGILVYSTCTLSLAENDKICEKFLNEHDDFRLDIPKSIEKFSDKDKQDTFGVTLFPHITGSDGFFVSVLRKKNQHV